MMEATQAPPPNTDATGSRTMTVTPSAENDAAQSSGSPPLSREGTPNTIGVLRLRGGPTRRQRVMWSAETVDNEGMGKKKSKICCIYHKPRRYDESSSESDSCSDDDDHDCSNGAAAQGNSSERACPPSGVEIEEASSESDGGGGDGRARPARPRKKQHTHGHASKANKYDSKGKSKE